MNLRHYNQPVWIGSCSTHILPFSEPDSFWFKTLDVCASEKRQLSADAVHAKDFTHLLNNPYKIKFKDVTLIA